MTPPCTQCGFDYDTEPLAVGQPGRAHTPAEIVDDVQMFVCAVECNPPTIGSPYLSLPPG